ncbi:MAG: hypothetical protein JWO78_1107 [Micavibrio sp.]|nr:hypothetical protein [Micavibrio sp.]
MFKSSSTYPAAHTYVAKIEDLLLNRYRKIIQKNSPEISELLRKKTELQGNEPRGAEPRKAKNRRMADYITFWNSLNDQQKVQLSAQDAKINHLARLIQTMGTTEVVQAHNKINATTAESFDFVLERFRQEEVTAKQLQLFIEENAVAWISLTGHPTNPTTVAYTKAQIALAKVLAIPESTFEDLDAALQVIYETPIVGTHKTPLQEAEETLATLDVIFDTTLPLRKFFIKSLNKYGYEQEGVTLDRPIIVPCSWTLGDGDGNNSLTAEVLDQGIRLHRATIAERYKEVLSKISTNVNNFNPGDLEPLQDDLAMLAQGKLSKGLTQLSLIKHIEHLTESIPDAGKGDWLDFIYLVKCFGLGFGTIDIRHNAAEILETAFCLVNISGLDSMSSLQKLSLDDAAAKLAGWLNDDAIIKKISHTSINKLNDSDHEAASRIWGRLKVIGENPDMCEKLIIAETTHPAHALAALLLLKTSGNIIGEEGSRIDLTILSESVKDLLNLGTMLETLLENKIFRDHVVSRKRLLVMIAKSDTTRQDGRGEAEFTQYEAAVEIYRVAEKMKRKYQELETVKTSIKNGGGHALQRGGGRVTEIAALHGRAAADARVTDIGPSTLTIQGEQLTILFCPGKVALGSLEAFICQNLYTKAGVRGEMPIPHFAKSINKQYARADAWLYAKTAGKAFDLFTKQNPAIDKLLINAPWLSMKAGNASSRPAKRGEKTVEPGITPAEAKGDDPKALQGRAISGERLTAHACLPIFSVLGLVEAMEIVRSEGQARINPHKYGDALHHLYRAHKIHRDGARATINAAVMADFDIAWPLLTGEVRPTEKDVKRLAIQFDPAGNSSPESTLAFLETYFLSVERLSYEMVSGLTAPKNFRFGDGLRKLWPELAAHVAHRDREAEFARVIECYRTRTFDQNKNIPLSENEFRITQALYASANVVNAPVGILATRTRLEPVTTFKIGRKSRFMRPKSFNELGVRRLLVIPNPLKNKS